MQCGTRQRASGPNQKTIARLHAIGTRYVAKNQMHRQATATAGRRGESPRHGPRAECCGRWARVRVRGTHALLERLNRPKKVRQGVRFVGPEGVCARDLLRKLHPCGDRKARGACRWLHPRSPRCCNKRGFCCDTGGGLLRHRGCGQPSPLRLRKPLTVISRLCRGARQQLCGNHRRHQHTGHRGNHRRSLWCVRPSRAGHPFDSSLDDSSETRVLKVTPRTSTVHVLPTRLALASYGKRLASEP